MMFAKFVKNFVTIITNQKRTSVIARFATAVTMAASSANFAQRMAHVGSSHQIRGTSTISSSFPLQVINAHLKIGSKEDIMILHTTTTEGQQQHGR